MNTLSSIFSNTHKGTCFIGFDSNTIVPLKGGKANVFQGRITKVMTGATAMVNSNYTNSRNKQLQVAGFKPTFVAQPRRWGIFPINNMPIITNVEKATGRNKVYLNTSIIKAGKVVYLLDNETVIPHEWVDFFAPTKSVGTGIATKEVEKQLAPMTDEERAIMAETIAINTGMLDEAMNNPSSIAVPRDIIDMVSESTKPVFPRDFMAESLTAIRVNGTEYTNISATEA
jgi:hypothetical protein